MTITPDRLGRKHGGESFSMHLGGAGFKGDSKLTDLERDKLSKDSDRADIIGEAVDKAPAYGQGARPIHTTLGKLGNGPVQEDIARGLERYQDGRDATPLEYVEDPAAPGGIWLLWSPAVEERILAGVICGWCGAWQRNQWGTEAGRMAVYMRGVPLHGDVTDPSHIAHEGGYCEPAREGAEGCNNRLRDGIYYAKDLV